MGQKVLVTEQTAGGRKVIDGLVVGGLPVTAAFWMRRDEDSRWRLYIVTPWVANPGPFKAYEHVRRAIDGCQWSDPLEAISPSDITLLEPTHTLATWVADTLSRYNGTIDTWVRAEWVGDGAVSGTYIYARIPAPAPQPAGS